MALKRAFGVEVILLRLLLRRSLFRGLLHDLLRSLFHRRLLRGQFWLSGLFDGSRSGGGFRHDVDRRSWFSKESGTAWWESQRLNVGGNR